MAITFNTAVLSSNSSANVTSHTVSHTVGSGTDMLLIGVFRMSGSLDDPLIDSVTYAAAACTLIREENNGGTSNSRTMSASHQTPPAAEGANNIVVTYTATALRSSISSQDFFADDDIGIRSHDGDIDSTDAPSISVPSESGDLIIDFLALHSTVTTHTPDTGQTQQYQASNNQLLRAGSRKAGAATATTMSWTLADATTWAYIGVSIKEETGAPPTVPDVPGWMPRVSVPLKIKSKVASYR